MQDCALLSASAETEIEPVGGSCSLSNLNGSPICSAVFWK